VRNASILKMYPTKKKRKKTGKKGGVKKKKRGRTHPIHESVGGEEEQNKKTGDLAKKRGSIPIGKTTGH